MNKLATLQHKSLYGAKREPTQDQNHKSLPLISVIIIVIISFLSKFNNKKMIAQIK